MFVYLHTILSGGSLRNVTIWKRAPTRAGRTKRRRRPFAAAGRALVGARLIFVQCRRSAELASLELRVGCALPTPFSSLTYPLTMHFGPWSIYVVYDVSILQKLTLAS
jgi:hypothetical protein